MDRDGGWGEASPSDSKGCKFEYSNRKLSLTQTLSLTLTIQLIPKLKNMELMPGLYLKHFQNGRLRNMDERLNLT